MGKNGPKGMIGMKFMANLRRRKKELEELEKQIDNLNIQIHQLQQTKDGMKREVDKTNQEWQEAISNWSSAIQEAQNTIENLRLIETGLGTLEEIGYTRLVPTMAHNELEKAIFNVECDIAFMTVNDTLITITRQYRIDGSEAKGRKFQENYGKNLLIGFNSYFQAKEKAVTEANYFKTVELVNNAYERFNKQGALIGVSIGSEYLKARMKIMKYKLQLKTLKAQEHERLREEKRRLKEQEKLLEEAERTKRELAKERKHYTQLLGRTIDEAEQEQIKAKLSEIDKREADVDYRLENAKAGWLYVISSPALQGMVKLGATRRLNPFIRIRELSSASIPYPFVCHGLVFSDDVFALENSVHQHFDEQRVNKSNGHKEFFEITPKEAIDVLTNKFNCKVQFAQEDEFGGVDE